MTDVGSIAGALWAAAHPDAFASAVLINGGVPIGYRWHALARLHRIPLVGELVVARCARVGLRTAMRRYNRPVELPRESLERWHRGYEWGTRRAMRRFHNSTEPSAIERLAPALRRLDRPALVVWGAHDGFVPLEQAERQLESFPSAEIVVLEDSGHYPQLDDPDRVAGAVIPFLRRQLSAGGD
jgi:pimeloyl-ACP methyl ester carboxylesterase